MLSRGGKGYCWAGLGWAGAPVRPRARAAAFFSCGLVPWAAGGGHSCRASLLKPACPSRLRLAPPAQAGKVKNTPWGSTFRAPPEILHGAPAPSAQRAGGAGGPAGGRGA